MKILLNSETEKIKNTISEIDIEVETLIETITNYFFDRYIVIEASYTPENIAEILNQSYIDKYKIINHVSQYEIIEKCINQLNLVRNFREKHETNSTLPAKAIRGIK